MPIEQTYEHSLAATIRDLVARGLRTLLVTSCTAAEGKSSVAADLGRSLARSGREGVVLVDADQLHPTLHRMFGCSPARGLSDLLAEVYGIDLAAEDAVQFGLGDWLEILRAQERTGELLVAEGDERYGVRILQGSVGSIDDRTGGEDMRLGAVLAQRGRISEGQRQDALRIQMETGRPLGEILRALGCASAEDIHAALHDQLGHRAMKLAALRQPECRFAELAEAYLPAIGARPPSMAASEGIDDLVNGRFHEYLRSPFLTSQIASYVSDTGLSSLRLVSVGSQPCDLHSPRCVTPFRLLVHRLARVYDIVLIDAPPVSMTSPTTTLARLVDGVLMVVKADGPGVASIRRSVDELRRAGANVLGVVLNRVDLTPDEGRSPFYETPIARSS